MGIRRAALLVGMAAAGGAVGCGGVSPDPPPDVVSFGDVYGTPPVDRPDAGSPPDVISASDVYGTPPVDRPDAGSPADVISASDVYGTPPDR